MTAAPKLLIVEDDPGLCGQYRWAFPGCALLFAHDQPGALAIAARDRPPLAILDLGLPPDPDGVSRRLRHARRPCCVKCRSAR